MCRPSQECRLCQTEPVPAAALSTSWVRLRLEFVVDADRAVMVGNNGNSDMRCTLAITGARRLRPAVKEGRAPALLCERWLGPARPAMVSLQSTVADEIFRLGFVHLEVEAQLYQAHFLDRQSRFQK